MKKQPWEIKTLGGSLGLLSWEVSDGRRLFQVPRSYDATWLRELLEKHDPNPPPRWKVNTSSYPCASGKIASLWEVTDGTQVFRNYQSLEYSEALAKTLNDLEK